MLKHVRCSQSALESRCLFHAAARCRALLVAAQAMWPLSGGAHMVCGPRSGLGLCVEWAVCERGVHVMRMRVRREAAPSAVARACESCCCDRQHDRECVCTRVYSTVPYSMSIRPYKQHAFRSSALPATRANTTRPRQTIFSQGDCIKVAEENLVRS